jgi:hypothetical protein
VSDTLESPAAGRIKKRLGILAVLAVAPWVAAHDDTDAVKAPVGSQLVNGESLRPFENSWRMQVTKKDGTTNADAGLWKDRFEVIDIDGKQYGVRVQDAIFKAKNGGIAATTRTVNVFERKTMAPVMRRYERHVTGKEDSSVHIAFKRGQMALESRAGGKIETRNIAAEPAFDFDGGLYALLWSAFPLKVGFAASLPSYSEDEHPEKVAWYTFRVTGRERIEAGGQGPRDCWIVEGDSGSGPLKYWLSAESPYIIRLQYQQPTTGASWLLTMT